MPKSTCATLLSAAAELKQLEERIDTYESFHR
jgi:hypothetical protein